MVSAAFRASAIAFASLSILFLKRIASVYFHPFETPKPRTFLETVGTIRSRAHKSSTKTQRFLRVVLSCPRRKNSKPKTIASSCLLAPCRSRDLLPSQTHTHTTRRTEESSAINPRPPHPHSSSQAPGSQRRKARVPAPSPLLPSPMVLYYHCTYAA